MKILEKILTKVHSGSFGHEDADSLTLTIGQFVYKGYNEKGKNEKIYNRFNGSEWL